MKIFMFVVWCITSFVALIGLILATIDGNIVVIRECLIGLAVGLSTAYALYVEEEL